MLELECYSSTRIGIACALTLRGGEGLRKWAWVWVLGTLVDRVNWFVSEINFWSTAPLGLGIPSTASVSNLIAVPPDPITFIVKSAFVHPFLSSFVCFPLSLELLSNVAAQRTTFCDVCGQPSKRDGKDDKTRGGIVDRGLAVVTTVIARLLGLAPRKPLDRYRVEM